MRFRPIGEARLPNLDWISDSFSLFLSLVEFLFYLFINSRHY